MRSMRTKEYITAVRQGTSPQRIGRNPDGDAMIARMDARIEAGDYPPTVDSSVPGDTLVSFLTDRGAERSDRAPTIFEGGRPAAVSKYVSLIESGDWEETDSPIVYDEETGVVGPGADRVAAAARVDWSRVPRVPKFVVRVRHSSCYDPVT